MDGATLPSDLPYAPEHTAVRVRALLLYTGLSKSDFGSALSLTPQQVTHLIQGRNAPTPATAYRIKRTFNVPGDWLYFDEAMAIPDATLRNGLLSLLPQARQAYEADLAKKKP